jgi:peptidoglycan/LPS O-acetylase OafA/YrhL
MNPSFQAISERAKIAIAHIREFVFETDTDRRVVSHATVAACPRPNWPALAGLRFVLASIVLWVHWAVFFLPADPAKAIPSVGHVAVAAFFIVSGFSIRHSYMKQSAGFYRRRILRLLPVHTLCFLLSAIPFLIWGSRVPLSGLPVSAPEAKWTGITSVVLAAGMMNGLFGTLYVGFGVTWALTVEVLLYLLVPVFAWLERRPGMLWAVIAGSAYLYWKWIDRLGGLGICGVGVMGWLWLLGWQFQRYGSKPIVRSVLLLASPLVVLTHNPAFARVLGILVGTNILFCHMDDVRFSARINRVLLWLGDLSFPLYLVHIPVITAFGAYRPSFLLAFGISVAFSIAILHADTAFRAWYGRKSTAIAPPSEIARAA